MTIGAFYKYEDIVAVWPQVSCFLADALKKAQGEFTVEDLFRKVVHCKAYLWAISDGEGFVGAGMTEIVDYPQKATVRILALGGTRLEEWLDEALAAVEAYAKSQNIFTLEASVRIGLVKKLRAKGFRPVYVTVNKNLDNPGARRSALEALIGD